MVQLVPSVAKFKAVVLPSTYRSVQSVAPADTSSVEPIRLDSEAFLSMLEDQHQGRLKRFDAWYNGRLDCIKQERKRLAPGYLDSQAHLLVPEKVRAASNGDEAPEEKEETPSGDNDTLSLAELKI